VSVVRRLTTSLLEESLLRTEVYPDLDHTFYWDDSWDPNLYIAAARAGFISITHCDPELGPLLMAELQRSYAVLDWSDLHRSKNLRRRMRSERLAEDGIELRIVPSVGRVLERIREHHGSSWLLEPYEALILELPRGDAPGFAIRGVELWSRRREKLLAGELGYTIGRAYTSLSGFCTLDDPVLRSAGMLQMILLAERLRDAGYAFWNLGHPEPSYKFEIGGRILSRAEFLGRWLEARDRMPAANLSVPSAAHHAHRGPPR
jgi:Leu/Phe-tRNA-protein transferase